MLTMLTQNSRPSTESYDELGCGRAGDGALTYLGPPLHETLRQPMIATTVKSN
jgi:hypothetical protein